MDEVGETVVGRVQGSVFRGNEMCVGTPVVRDLGRPELQALHDRVPHGGVVHARLPRVADIHESLIFRVALPVEVLVPRHKLRERVLEERPGAHDVLGALIDPEGGRRVNRRLDNAAGPDLLRSVRALVGVPEVYAREVPAEVGIEYDLGQEPVVPLGVEEMCKLPRGALLGIVRVPDGDERRVPGPLVRVESGAWLGVLPGPVQVQNQLRFADEIDFVFQHAVCLPLGTDLVANPQPTAPSAIPGISTDTLSRRIPARAQASPIVEMARPTTVTPAYSPDTSATLFRRSPRLAHPPDQERQADYGYQQADELYAEEPHKRCAFHAGEGIPQCVQDDGRRERSPDPPVEGCVTHLGPLPPQYRANQPGPGRVSRG